MGVLLSEKAKCAKNRFEKNLIRTDVGKIVNEILDSVKQQSYSSSDILYIADYLLYRFYNQTRCIFLRIYVTPNISEASLSISVYDIYSGTYENRVKEIYTTKVYLMASTQVSETHSAADLLVRLYGVTDRQSRTTAYDYLTHHGVDPKHVSIDQYPILAEWYKNYSNKETPKGDTRKALLEKSRRIRLQLVSVLGQNRGIMTYLAFKQAAAKERSLLEASNEAIAEAAEFYKAHGFSNSKLYGFTSALRRILNGQPQPKDGLQSNQVQRVIEPILGHEKVKKIYDLLKKIGYDYPEIYPISDQQLAEAARIYKENGCIKGGKNGFTATLLRIVKPKTTKEGEQSCK